MIDAPSFFNQRIFAVSKVTIFAFFESPCHALTARACSSATSRASRSRDAAADSRVTRKDSHACRSRSASSREAASAVSAASVEASPFALSVSRAHLNPGGVAGSVCVWGGQVTTSSASEHCPDLQHTATGDQHLDRAFKFHTKCECTVAVRGTKTRVRMTPDRSIQRHRAKMTKHIPGLPRSGNKTTRPPKTSTRE